MNYDPDGYARLRLYAEMFADLDQEVTRIGNRLGLNAKGETVRPLNVDVAKYLPHFLALREVRHKIDLDLMRCFREVLPAGVIAWQKEEKGIGEHLLARLLGHVGHPRVGTPHWWGENLDYDSSKPSSREENQKRILVAGDTFDRTISQLWSYCGHGDPTRKRYKNMPDTEAMGLGNPEAKKLLFLLADACVKAGVREQSTVSISHYGEVYLKRRANTENRVHADQCVRCGPSGKPALAGSPWSKMHQLADAKRIIGKEILRDLWIAAG